MAHQSASAPRKHTPFLWLQWRIKRSRTAWACCGPTPRFKNRSVTLNHFVKLQDDDAAVMMIANPDCLFFHLDGQTSRRWGTRRAGQGGQMMFGHGTERIEMLGGKVTCTPTSSAMMTLRSSRG